MLDHQQSGSVDRRCAWPRLARSGGNAIVAWSTVLLGLGGADG